MTIGETLRMARDLLYPPVCIACGEETGAAGGFCARCFAEAAFLSPPICARCGAPVPGGVSEGAAEEAGAVCDGCLRAPPSFDSARAAALYGGPIRRATLALKYGDRLDVAEAAAPWLARAGATLLAEADLIAPAPLHWTRLVLRRFNQAAELARETARAAGRDAALAPDLLVRTRRTPSQEGKTRAARRENMRNAFRVRPSWADRVIGARILLVDDVITTGATLSACAEALFAAGADGVDALALARVARDDAPPYVEADRTGGPP